MKRYITELKNDIAKVIRKDSTFEKSVIDSLIWKLDRIHTSEKAGLQTAIDAAREMIEVYEIYLDMR